MGGKDVGGGRRGPGRGVGGGSGGGSATRLRLVLAIENRCAPGVDGHARERGRPEEPCETMSAQRDEENQIRRVVEREAKPELEPAAVLVEKSRDCHHGHGQPERPVQPWRTGWRSPNT